MASLSFNLLTLIVLAFVLQLIVPGFTEIFFFHPLWAISAPWQFITSIFLHGGITHLFFNGYALFVFGTVLERVISRRDFLILFFGAGIVGSILYYLTFLAGVIPPLPALGASGAVYGILGALAMLTPNLTIFFWFFPMKIRTAAIFWFILEFMGTFDITSGVASAAHLGGLAFGIAYAHYLKNKGTIYAFY